MADERACDWMLEISLTGQAMPAYALRFDTIERARAVRNDLSRKASGVEVTGQEAWIDDDGQEVSVCLGEMSGMRIYRRERQQPPGWFRMPEVKWASQQGQGLGRATEANGWMTE